MDDAITFSGVAKRYPYYQHIAAGLKSFLFNLPKSISLLKQSSFTALNDVSFRVKKGETFGIVGRNGSGKSTILSLMGGVIRQDKGEIRTVGRISSLLELGAGFHPDLSGIENIILNGILMGHTRNEMLGKVDMIVEFSELGDFIYQPLRTYSSGMHVRLAFSVAVHVDPEILLVDEALAVGDISFQEKCMKKMLEFRESGTTIVIVSHDLTSIVRLCDRALWIDNGSVVEAGPPKDVVMNYIRSLEQHELMSTVRAADLENPAVPDEAPAEEPVTAEQADADGVPPGEAEADEPPPILTWWDSPVVVLECEKLISGNPVYTFYDYLKRQFAIGHLDKGLMICNQLKGIEVNFAIHNICKSFDVFDSVSDLKRIIAGDHSLPVDTYDMFVCVDLLNRMKDPGLLLDQINRSLKDDGIIIALEYIGPVNYQRPETDYLIANMLYKLLHDGTVDTSPDWLFDRHADFPLHGEGEVNVDPLPREGAISSGQVIPMVKKHFDLLDLRYFGGPLYDLLLDRFIGENGLYGEKGSKLVKTVIQYEQALIREKILGNNYAMLLGRKSS
jgi:lipopolysaccharide transport system ATP-binding protein